MPKRLVERSLQPPRHTRLSLLPPERVDSHLTTMSLYGTSTCIFDWCAADSFIPIWQIEALAEQQSQQQNPFPYHREQETQFPHHSPDSSSSPSDFEEEPMVLSSERTTPPALSSGGPSLRLSVNTETDHNDPMVISPRSNGIVSWGDTPSNPCSQNGCLPTAGSPQPPQQPLAAPFSIQAQPSWNFVSVVPGSPLPPGSSGGVVGVGGPHVLIHPHQQQSQQGGLHLPQQLHHLYDHSGCFDNNRFAQPPHEVLQKLELGRLEVSKSPIMEALVFCAFAGWGVELVNDSDSDISFRFVEIFW